MSPTQQQLPQPGSLGVSATQPQQAGKHGSAQQPLAAAASMQNGRHCQEPAPADSAATKQQPQQGAAYWFGRAQRAISARASCQTQMLREYQHVLELDHRITTTTAAAKSRAAAGRNRYSNVLPYDHNRVVLQQDGGSSGSSSSGTYVNASTVTVQLPGVEQPCSYIATQGPLPATVADFWRMVTQQGVPAVVMLTNVTEGGLPKCAPYHPAAPGATTRAGGVEVTVECVAPLTAECTQRTLVVRDTSASGGGGAPHRLQHYHMHAWPDHGTPASSAGIRALCRELAGARHTGRPIVVHCSAGIGRTGTFCAIDFLLQRLDGWSSSAGGGPDRSEVEAALDVPALVAGLRSQRMGMVQTLEQYAFIYRALLDDLADRLDEGGGGHNT